MNDLPVLHGKMRRTDEDELKATMVGWCCVVPTVSPRWETVAAAGRSELAVRPSADVLVAVFLPSDCRRRAYLTAGRDNVLVGGGRHVERSEPAAEIR